MTGSLQTHETVNAAMHEAITCGEYNGYGPAVGIASVSIAFSACPEGINAVLNLSITLPILLRFAKPWPRT
jgi:hypothetical protein